MIDIEDLDLYIKSGQTVPMELYHYLGSGPEVGYDKIFAEQHEEIVEEKGPISDLFFYDAYEKPLEFLGAKLIYGSEEDGIWQNLYNDNDLEYRNPGDIDKGITRTLLYSELYTRTIDRIIPIRNPEHFRHEALRIAGKYRMSRYFSKFWANQISFEFFEYMPLKYSHFSIFDKMTNDPENFGVKYYNMEKICWEIGSLDIMRLGSPFIRKFIEDYEFPKKAIVCCCGRCRDNGFFRSSNAGHWGEKYDKQRLRDGAKVWKERNKMEDVKFVVKK